MIPKRMILISLILILFISFFGSFIYMLNRQPQKPLGINTPKNSFVFSWKKVSHGISEAEVVRIASSNFGRPAFYAGTSKAIYKSTTGMSSYLASLYLEGSQKQVNDFYVDVLDRAIYAATDSGLYVSLDEGERWEKIYFVKESREEKCYCVLASGSLILLGTSQGLFVSDKNKISWKQFDGYFENKSIFDLLSDQKFIYAVLESDVYRLQSNFERIEKVFSISSQETDTDDLSGSLADRKVIRSVTIAEGNPSIIWVVSAQGIFYSEDFSKNWKCVPHESLSLDLIMSSIYAHDAFFIAGQKGVYVLQDNGWRPIYQGSEATRFNHLSADAQGNVYAATDTGIFKLLAQNKDSDQSMPITSPVNGDEYFLDEPSIRDVQRASIQYAQVDPEKIKTWQTQVQKKAWLPEFSIGMGGDKNRTTSDNIYGSYTGGGQSYIGPDDKTFYNNFGWDVSLSWDLSDLIWNSEQTSIDSRSKLMTELREDILNEVTRLYFERRRLQYEILGNDNGYSDVDIEKKMRLEELTALIDALTGGTFSQEIERKASYKL